LGYTGTARKPDREGVQRAALIAVFAVTSLALAGSAVAGAPTKGQFIRRGDALCTSVRRELVPVRRQAEAAKSLPESQQWAAVTRIWTAQVKIQGRFNARFRAIGVPSGDSVARGLVAGLGRGLTLARRVRDGFATRDQYELAKALPAYVRFTTSLNRRVVAYGFRVCGRS
jgi:hypothetical protein